MTSEERDALREQRTVRTTNKARSTPPPADAPAMTATLGVLLPVPDEVLWLDVCEGADEVDDGELTLRHEESVEPPTVLRTSTPPCLPCESVMKNKRLVPS